MARRTAKQKAATRKLVALNRRRKRSTRKGQRRVTARRAYTGLKRRVRRRRSSSLKRPTRRRTMRKSVRGIFGSSTLKKIALGVGGGAMAALAINAIAPQFANIAKPAGAYALGGIEGIVGSFAVDMFANRSGPTTTGGTL
jgi:hypothetical protein